MQGLIAAKKAAHSLGEPAGDVRGVNKAYSESGATKRSTGTKEVAKLVKLLHQVMASSKGHDLKIITHRGAIV